MTSNSTLFLTVQLTCERFLQKVALIWEAHIFTSDNAVLVLFCFLKTMFVPVHQESDVQKSLYAFEC